MENQDTRNKTLGFHATDRPFHQVRRPNVPNQYFEMELSGA